MTEISSELMLQAIGGIATAAAIYGGIRSDLKSMKEAITAAHERLDNHLENHRPGRRTDDKETKNTTTQGERPIPPP